MAAGSRTIIDDMIGEGLSDCMYFSRPSRIEDVQNRDRERPSKEGGVA